MATIQDDVVRLEKADGSRKLVTTDCVYDLTEDKTQEAVNSEIKNTLTQLGTEVDTVENGLAIIVEGNTCTSGASQGQYVYLKNSTITGYADGLYTAAQAIPANTAIDGTYLTAVSGGGLNSLNDKLANGWVDITAACIWNTAYLGAYKAYYNSLSKSVAVYGVVLAGTPNQTVLCTLSKTPVFDQLIGRFVDIGSNPQMTVDVAVNVGRQIKSSHSVNANLTSDYVFGGFIAVAD